MKVYTVESGDTRGNNRYGEGGGNKKIFIGKY